MSKDIYEVWGTPKPPFESPKDILGLYEDETATVPRLSPRAAQAANRLLRSSGYIDIAGYSPAESGLTIGEVMGMRAMYDQYPDGEICRGPYFLHGDTEMPLYVASGIAIWLRPEQV